MNIHTVKENLIRTITGKQDLLDSCRKTIADYDALDDQCDAWLRATITAEFLEINIAELRRILTDVEICCVKATEDSWRLNPDRSGGQFTQDEVDNAGKW
jgi:hypothetical protein